MSNPYRFTRIYALLAYFQHLIPTSIGVYFTKLPQSIPQSIAHFSFCDNHYYRSPFRSPFRSPLPKYRNFQGWQIWAFEGRIKGRKKAFERLIEHPPGLCDCVMLQKQQTPPKSPFYGRVAGFFLCDDRLHSVENRAKFRRFSKGDERNVTFSVEHSVQTAVKCDTKGTRCDISFFR